MRVRGITGDASLPATDGGHRPFLSTVGLSRCASLTGLATPRIDVNLESTDGPVIEVE